MNTPFTKAHVLRVTVNHQRRAIDLSIRKTTQRWEEFKENPYKTKEIVETLMELHTMRAMLDDYQDKNSELFKETI